ncbi:unnamed protein product, partial [Staurois parvus]
LHLAQCSQTSTILLTTAKTQTCSSDCQTEKRDSSFQRTHLHRSRVQWRLAGLLLFPVASTLL